MLDAQLRLQVALTLTLTTCITPCQSAHLWVVGSRNMSSRVLHLLLRVVQRYGSFTAFGFASSISWFSYDPDQLYIRAPLSSRGTGKLTSLHTRPRNAYNLKLTESVASPNRLGLSRAGGFAGFAEHQLVV